MQESLFQTLFNHLTEPRIVVKADTPRFTIVACNDQYKKVSNTTDKGIIGKGIREIHSTKTADLNEDVVIRNALNSALQTNSIVKLGAVRYDIPVADGSKLEQSWWQAEYVPIPGEHGQVEYLMCTIHNITEQVLGNEAMKRTREQEESLQREKELTEDLTVTNEQLHLTQEKLSGLTNGLEERVTNRIKELAASENYFRNMILQAPVAIGLLAGREMVVETINDKLLEVWDKKRESVIGKPVRVALPEMEGQPYPQILDEVFTSGKAFHAGEAKVLMYRNGVLKEGYYDFINHPLKDKDGNTTSIMVVAIDVTERVQARLKEQEFNEELAAINEELNSSNEELVIIQKRLQEALTETELSRSRFYNMIHSSPVAKLILRGDDLIIEEANQPLLQIIGRDSSVKGKPLMEILPELSGQPIMDTVYHTYRTGEETKVSEAPIMINHDGKPYQGYFNITYTALKEGDRITGLMQSALDVTEQVNARRIVELAEERLRAAIDAAQLGTFSVNIVSGEFIIAVRTKELLGFDKQDEITARECLNQVREDYRALVRSEFVNAMTNGKRAEIDFPVIGYRDGKLRWLRCVAQVQQSSNGAESVYTGVLVDITERKLDEQRKDNFIGMVSHELKTPLTSLSTYMQIIQEATKGNDDDAIYKMMEIANKQVSKMNTLINGFLNVSRLESGKIHIDRQQFNMADLVKEVEEESRITISSHKLVFAPVEYTLVNADRDKIGQVINNLISNAVKYSPYGSTINIACVTFDRCAQFSVRDEGIGIAPRDQEKLFQRYYRAENHYVKNIAGFGIGLYLCAEIIQRHEGKIWVESEVDKGSIFYFSLPVV